MSTENTREEVSQVRAEINYIRNPPAQDEALLEFFSESEEFSTMQTLPGREVWIRDARTLSSSLDREGFVLAPHSSAIDNLENVELDAAKNAAYVAELIPFLIDLTGASRVVILGGAKQRFSECAIDKLAPLVNAKPARYPHADNTDASSSAQIKMIAAATADLDLAAYPRCALFNIWRCISPAPQISPLAVCDARSISPADEIAVCAVTPILGHGDYRHETSSYLYNPAHRWHYYPDMTDHEVIVFKTHDTDASRARRVAHTAFDDNTCIDVHARASVEVRALALFK